MLEDTVCPRLRHTSYFNEQLLNGYLQESNRNVIKNKTIQTVLRPMNIKKNFNVSG